MSVASLTDLIKSCSLEGEFTLTEAVTLGGLDSLVEEGRPKALAFLKENGVDKLGQRQKLVNELTKAKREGRLNLAGGGASTPAPPSEPAAAPVVDVSDVPPAAAAAAPGQLRWLVDISSWEPSNAEWQLLLNALPEEESTKVMRFKFVADQKRALASRYLQRRACFETTGVPWSSVQIVRTKGGKPFMKKFVCAQRPAARRAAAARRECAPHPRVSPAACARLAASQRRSRACTLTGTST
jgi:hypothetical protein